MNIATIKIQGFAALAPMAGVADYAVRTISRAYGAGYTVGEMVSAKGVAMGSQKSLALLTPDVAHPHGVQLFGSAPDYMRQAAEQAAAMHPDVIDLNMGCPAPKITNGGAGSALLKDLPLACAVLSAVLDGAGNIPVTVKLRKGYELQDDVCVEAAQRFEQLGAAALTIHGRTRAQMYAPPVDLTCIAAVKRAVAIPVIGNGDIFTPQDAKCMFEQTGCDLVMVGRGALGNPWLFAGINALLQDHKTLPAPALSQRLAVMQQQIELLLQDKGEYTGLREARKHVAWYMTGLRGAAQLRRCCGEISSRQDIDSIVQQALSLGEPEEES